MTNRQRKFIDAYIEKPNAAEAARKAGYSPSSARTAGSQLLQKKAIQAEISARMAENAASANEVINTLTDIMRGALIVDGKPPRICDRLRAAELLGKRYGLFTEKVEIGGAGDAIIEIVGD